MMILISGGSGSGKSSYAESLVLRSKAQRRIYLATMEVWGEEDRRRVERHQAMRKAKNFETIERTTALEGAEIPTDSVVLLEDLSNLTANECFGGAGFHGAKERILNGIGSVYERCRDLVIVTNELFSDGVTYPAETERYLDLLAELNRILAERSDAVIESVVGIPIYWKGTEHELF